MGDFLDRMRAENPDAVARAERLVDEWLNPLTHFRCPTCDVRFGVEASYWKFLEQTGASLWCPCGHELRLSYQPPAT